MIVYRAERPCGEGPFQFPHWQDVDYAMSCHTGDLGHNDNPRFPGVYSDVKGIYYGDGTGLRYTACRSLGQWRTWFPKPVAKVLKRHGFLLRTFEVPEGSFALGRRQLLFDRDAARLLADYDPVTKEVITVH